MTVCLIRNACSVFRCLCAIPRDAFVRLPVGNVSKPLFVIVLSGFLQVSCVLYFLVITFDG